MGKIRRLLTNPRAAMLAIIRHTCPLWPDKLFLETVFRLKMGRRLRLKEPVTFNEKLQWLKLYHRIPQYVTMVDKVKAKDYVASKIGAEYIIPTLGVWSSADEIDFDSLPDKFVIKCNHNSGTGMYICKDKAAMDVERVRRGLARGLEENYYIHGREWPYRDVPRRIIAEEFLDDHTGEDLRDYKFFCFNGKVKFLKVDIDRYTQHKTNYYSPDWELQSFYEADFSVETRREIKCPENFDRMLALAERLAEGIPFVRVDFYDVAGRIYFGEITFFPASGFGKWSPEEADEQIGRLIELPVQVTQ